MRDLIDEFNPENLEQAVEALDKVTEDSPDRNEWLADDEKSALISAHHSLGQNIRNTWGLWDETSVLYKWFKERGIWHADDMSSIILVSYHREKNNKAWDVDEQIKEYKKYWKKNKKWKKKRKFFI